MVEASELDVIRCNASEPTKMMLCHYEAKLIIHLSSVWRWNGWDAAFIVRGDQEIVMASQEFIIYFKLSISELET